MRLLILLGFSFFLLSCKSQTNKKDQNENILPNIVIFIGDDMNWNDCEPYGSKVVKTPNIQKLANEGMSFDNMFTSTAMCAPTRQQLMTGLYPIRSGAYPNHSEVYEGVKSFAHYFGDLGYEVALIGKQHYGPADSFPIKYLGGVQHDTGVDGDDIDLGKIEPIVSGKSPFFLIIAQNQPHSPWNRGETHQYKENELVIPEYMVDSPMTRSYLSSYYSEITYMDSLLGKTMDIINKAKKINNTISIFTSEQGYAFPYGKWTCYDLGLKTAFIAKWPGKIEPNTRNKVTTQYVDILPTLLEAVGQNPLSFDVGIEDAEGNRNFDGRSFYKAIKGEIQSHRDYTYGIHTTRGVINGSESYPIRSVRSNRYKYIQNLSHNDFFYNVLTADTKQNSLPLLYQSWLENAKTEEQLNWVKHYKKRPFEELYDLENDPYEKVNLADHNEYYEIKKNLENQLKSWMHQQGDLGIESEMKALSRQNRKGKGEWHSYPEKLKTKI
ncbi:MAG: sulfatase [Flavobacteriaceae bacterium]|jgi:N-sulfoglucosamine sulfohydrolase